MHVYIYKISSVNMFASIYIYVRHSEVITKLFASMQFANLGKSNTNVTFNKKI